MKVGDGRDVPRVAGYGARKEGSDVKNEEGDNQFYKLLRKPGDRGPAQGRNLQGTPKEKLLDFGFAPPPDLGSEQFGRYGGDSPYDE